MFGLIMCVLNNFIFNEKSVYFSIQSLFHFKANLKILFRSRFIAMFRV